MRVLLLTYGSRGDVEPMAALAARLRTLGVEREGARTAAPPDEEFATLLGAAGVSVVPFWSFRRVAAVVYRGGAGTTTASLSAALATAPAPETRSRAASLAGSIRTDGTAAVAARPLLDALG